MNLKVRISLKIEMHSLTPPIASVLDIERQTGWSIVSASSSSGSAGPLMTMCYRDQLRLSFYPGAFSTGDPSPTSEERKNMPVELTYAPGTSKKSAYPSTAQPSPICSFVSKSLDCYTATIQQSTITPRQFLRFISETWDRVLVMEEEARMLELCGVTKLKIAESGGNINNSTLRARCTLLSRRASKGEATPAKKRTVSSTIAAIQKRIDVDFIVKSHVIPSSARNGPDDSKATGSMYFETDVTASKVYGEVGISEKGMCEILRKELGTNVGKGKESRAPQLGDGTWQKAVQALLKAVF